MRRSFLLLKKCVTASKNLRRNFVSNVNFSDGVLGMYTKVYQRS